MTGGFLRRNWGLKLFSLLLAYVAWAYVVSRSPSVRFVSVPVEFVPPEGMAILDYNPREVRVRLQGDAPVLNRLNEQGLYARVQLEPSLKAGRPQKIAVQDREVIGVPNGLLREIVTPSLTVTVEKRVVRSVPVRVRLGDPPPTGFRVVKSWAEPDVVEISGPEESMRSVTEIQTEPVDARNHRRPFTALQSLTKPDALVSLRPEAVRVNILAEEVPGPVEMTLPVRPNLDGFDVDPAVVKAVIEAPPSLLQRISGRVAAVADVDGRSSTAGVRLDFGALALDETAKIRVLALDPARVRVRRSAP